MARNANVGSGSRARSEVHMPLCVVPHLGRQAALFDRLDLRWFRFFDKYQSQLTFPFKVHLHNVLPLALDNAPCRLPQPDWSGTQRVMVAHTHTHTHAGTPTVRTIVAASAFLIPKPTSTGGPYLQRGAQW
jgi:hypothetical protein